MASVQITTRVDRQGVYLVATTSVKFLLDLPPDDTPRPWVATITANFNPDILLVIESDFYAIDFPFAFPNVSQPYTMTVVQGSEEFISITTAVSTTTEVETRAPITTEMRIYDKCRNSLNDGSYNSRKNDNHCNDGIFDKDNHNRGKYRSGES